MHDKELLNSWRKFERGEYRLQNGDKPDELMSRWMSDGFSSEFQKRGMDPSYQGGRPEPPPADY